MWTMNFQIFKLVLEKAEEPKIKLATSAESLKKQESFRKPSIFALLTMSKPLTVWITINCGKFWNTRAPDLPLDKPRHHIKKQRYHPDDKAMAFFSSSNVQKVLHSICQQIWKTQQCPQDWKRAVFIPFSKKGNAKECSKYHTIALISHATKVMLKILQARLHQYMNQRTSRY